MQTPAEDDSQRKQHILKTARYSPVKTCLLIYGPRVEVRSRLYAIFPLANEAPMRSNTFIAKHSRPARDSQLLAMGVE